MANPTNKLTVIKDGKTYLCQTYGDELDATPVGGIPLKIFQHSTNTEAYLGLLPINSDSDYHTPLQVTKNGKSYYIQSEVHRAILITLKPIANHSLALEYTNLDGTKQTTYAGNSEVIVEALYGTQYKVTLLPNTGYTAGTLNVPASGTVLENFDIAVSGGSVGTFVITANVPTGATISIGGTTYQAGKHTIAVKYLQKLVISSSSTNAAQYRVYDLKVNGSNFTSGNTYTMIASDIEITCSAEIIKYTVNITKNIVTDFELRQGSLSGAVVNSGSVVNYGTEIYVKATIPANTAQYTYKNLSITVNGTVVSNNGKFTVKANASVVASCERTVNNYQIAITQTSNQTIIVNAGGKDYTSTFSVPYGTQWYARISAASDYVAGSLNATSGTLTSNISISATQGARPSEQCFSFSYSIGNGYNLTYSNGYVNMGLGSNSYINNPPIAMNGLVTEINYISGQEVEFKLNVPQGITKLLCIIPHRDSGDEHEENTNLYLNGQHVWWGWDRMTDLSLGHLFPSEPNSISENCYAKTISVTPNTTYTVRFYKGTNKFKDWRRYPTVFYMGEKIEHPEMCTVTIPAFEVNFKVTWTNPWSFPCPADETSWSKGQRVYTVAKGVICNVNYDDRHYYGQRFCLNGNMTCKHSAYTHDDTPSCFIAGTKVLMADGTYKAIENIEQGDKVQGVNGVNTVLLTEKSLIPDRINIVRVGKLGITDHHMMWTETNGDRYWSVFSRDNFNYVREIKDGMVDEKITLPNKHDTSIIQYAREHGLTDYVRLPLPKQVLQINETTKFATIDGYREFGWEIDKDFNHDDIVYNLYINGDHTMYAEGFLVGGKVSGDIDYEAMDI